MRTSIGVIFSARPQLSLDATIQSPVKNVASILQRTFRGEKPFFQANEGKVIPFSMVITPLIVFVTEFLAVFASYPPH